MLLNSLTQNNRKLTENDPMPRLHAATEKLRLYADHHQGALCDEARFLLEDALSAAAEAEQNMAIQRARLRYLENLTLTDDLTGLLNRRGFDQELKRALARARRQGERGLLVLCDLDGFKAINDTYGHPAGDRVLCGLADLLRFQTRQTDYIARIGGDEFALLMTHTATDRARLRLARIERSISRHAIPWRGLQLPISASFGSEPYGPQSQPETLFFLADKDLYNHKRPRLVHDATAPDTNSLPFLQE